MTTYPKIELHVHLEGAIRPGTLLSIARRNGETLPADTVEGLTEMYEFTDFDHFIKVWFLTTNCLRTAEDFTQIVVDYAAEAASYGAVYVEGIFSPPERVERGMAWATLYEGYADGVAAAREQHGVEVRLTPDLYRNGSPELAEECARWSVRYADRGIVGLGIGGIEVGRPVRPYVRAFDIARDGGLAVVPHSGETAGPDSMREVVELLRPDRIRHGIHAVDDPALLSDIVAAGTVLDVCPTSNLRTRAVADLADHPLPALLAAGAQCTINTDDPAMFNTDLGQEYEIAAKLGVTPQSAYAAGVAGAACDEATRDRLRAIGADTWPA
ncbi:MAG TPA: adenosine deaminase [Actinocatenispora sp.]